MNPNRVAELVYAKNHGVVVRHASLPSLTIKGAEKEEAVLITDSYGLNEKLTGEARMKWLADSSAIALQENCSTTDADLILVTGNYYDF